MAAKKMARRGDTSGAKYPVERARDSAREYTELM